MLRRLSLLSCLSLLPWAGFGCSNNDSRGGPTVGHEPPKDAAHAGAGAPALGNADAGGQRDAGGGAAVGKDEGALRVRVEQGQGLAIEIVTLQCAGDCARVSAVASGGNPPYAFAWDDGSTAPERSLCAVATQRFEVSVSDTAIDDDEFRYEARTARTTLTANVLDCPATVDRDGGSTPLTLCADGASPSFQILSRVPSTDTGTFMQMNGALADYRVEDQLSGVTGLPAPSTLVRQATLDIDIGTCTKLLLAGDAAGAKPLGWDNELIIEYRSAPGGAVEKRWFYGSSQGLGATDVIYVPTEETLAHPLEPSVAGFDLDPPVPNPLPFGYPPLAIDLMSELPAGAAHFELTLYVIDTGGVGSTTDIWAIPQ